MNATQSSGLLAKVRPLALIKRVLMRFMLLTLDVRKALIAQSQVAVPAGTRPDMKVLIITNLYPTPTRPGATPAVRDQVEMLEELGVTVSLIIIDPDRKWQYLTTALRILALNFMPHRYDLIHAHYGFSGALALLQFRYPVVVTFHGGDLLQRDARIGKPVAHHAHGVIVMSEQMKAVSDRDDAYIIPFGIDSSVFRPMPKDQARAALGLDPDKRLILFAWDPRRPVKRYPLAVSAVEKLRERLPDVEMVTVYKQTREVVAQYMAACDVLTLVSMTEGSPLAVREAVSCHLPVVALDVGDIRSVIDGIEGCYITKPEPEAIADDLERVLREPRRLAASDIPDTISVRYGSERVLEVYQQMLQPAVEGKPA